MRTFLRIIAACCVMALTGLTVFAQTDRVVISGTVKSESGDPLVGASVIVKGATTRGTIVEVDGTYSISAAEGETLVYDCLGFVSQEVKLTGKSRIDIVMIEDTNFLDETIVVGYAPMRKSDFTGSRCRDPSVKRCTGCRREYPRPWCQLADSQHFSSLCRRWLSCSG